ncbi:MAG: M4 family metallopeptidase [Butyrivibrio sp.]|nr:M4 family metallopeptidase [Butyrivibrio sp.]
MRRRSYLAIVLSVLMLFFTACGKSNYSSYTIGGSDKSDSVFGSGSDSSGEDQTGSGSIFGDDSSDNTDESDTEETGSIFSQDEDDGGIFTVEEEPDGSAHLTEEDIQAMNNGNAIFVYSNEGYLSTLVGRYYNKKIVIKPGSMETAEDAINSLNGIASLLGLQEDTRFFCSNMAQDGKKYTYVTYEQRYGESTVMNATLHIVIDPEGYPCCVSSSFTPKLDALEYEEVLSRDEVFEMLKEYYPDYTWYPEASTEATIWFSYFEQIVNCYVYFSDNPERNSAFDEMRYLQLYVAKDGSMIYWQVPTSTLSVEKEDSYYSTDEYFEGMESRTWSGTVDYQNDGIENVTINVAFNPKDNLYYMMDLDRKIAVADYYDFSYAQYYEPKITFLTSADNTWDERDIATMYNFEITYDAYKDIGIKSPDGFETPLLLLRKFCDENHEGVYNAVYISQAQGWFTFGYSEACDFSYCLDAMAHEFTHAVTESSILGNAYFNDSGAINEAYSDIMGNIIQTMAGRGNDSDWLIGETGSNNSTLLRSMSDPQSHHQPDSIGGNYYIRNVENPDSEFNDMGGVHCNSGIVNYAAYLIYKSGLDLDTMFDLFYTSMQVLTPANKYEDVYAALIYSARANGYTQAESAIKSAFEQVRVIGHSRTELENAVPSDGGVLTCKVINYEYENVLFRLEVYDIQGQWVMNFYPDENGLIYAALPQGQYQMLIQAINSQTYQQGIYVLTDGGWAQQGNPAVVTVQNGQTFQLPDA